MFNFSLAEIALIAVIAVVALGPKRLPDILRRIAKTYGDLKRSLHGFRETFEQASAVDDKEHGTKRDR